MRIAANVLRTLLLAFTAIYSASGFSQQVVDAQTIVSQALATSGQGSPMLQGTILSGITIEHGVSGTVVIETKGTNVRYSFSLGGRQIVSIYANGVGWRIVNGVRQSLPIWVTEYKRANHLAAISRLADALRPNNVVQLLGVENVSGCPVYHLRISSIPTDATPADIVDWLSEFHVYIDLTSRLIVKTTGFDYSPDGINNRSQVDTYFSDYRTVGGIKLPFHITSYVENQIFSDMQFDSVQLAVALPDSDFR